MTSPASAEPIGLLASGGLDSCILLATLLDEGRHVQPFYVRSGLAWEADELAGLRRFLAALAGRNGQSRGELAELVVLDMPLGDLYGRHWSVTGREVPDHSTPDEAVFLPGRNALLIVKPATWCQLHGISQLALATLKSNPFPDAIEPFFAALGAALSRGGGAPLEIVRPFERLSKTEVMQLGRGYPLAQTFSCIAPRRGLHCGECNKCAERIAAFRAAEIPDTITYASATDATAALNSRVPSP